MRITLVSATIHIRKSSEPLSAIYGLFYGAHCVYVGQSVKPHERVIVHRSQKKMVFDAGLILDIVPKQDAPMAEGRWIALFKKLGQAEHNKFCKVAFNGRDLESTYTPSLATLLNFL